MKDLLPWALNEFVSCLAIASVVEGADPELFRRAVNVALDSGFTGAELAGALRVDPGTLSRWAHGQASPPAYARVGLLKDLRELLSTRLAEDHPSDPGPIPPSD